MRGGLVAFSGVLGVDQFVKAVGAASDGVERVLAVDSTRALLGVVAFAVTALLLARISRIGMGSPVPAGLILGGLGSMLIDGLATGVTAGVSVADVAVLIGVVLGTVAAFRVRPAGIFHRGHRLLT